MGVIVIAFITPLVTLHVCIYEAWRFSKIFLSLKCRIIYVVFIRSYDMCHLGIFGCYPYNLYNR